MGETIIETVEKGAADVVKTVEQNVVTTFHNFEDLLSGKTDFNGFKAGEGAMIASDIAKLPAPLQPAASLLYDSFKAGASTLVGLGQTAVGPLVSESSDSQATLLLNLLGVAGVPTTGPLSLAEHAVLVQIINGLKAGLDRIGLQITTAGVQAAAPTQKAS